MTTNISAETLSPITHNQIPVITTELLAKLYGTTTHSITKNHRSNIERFVAGKHYFKVVGQELVTLRVTYGDLQISPKTRSLILWTERGAARHAKMLETDQAWEVFEKLEDFYFSQKGKTEPVRQNALPGKITAEQQDAIKQLVLTRGKALPKEHQAKAMITMWSALKSHFGCSYKDITDDQFPEALSIAARVALEGEFLGRETLPVASFNQFTDDQLCTLAWLWRASTVMIQTVDNVYPLVRAAEHPQAARCYSITQEYPRTLREAQRIIAQATMHIHYEQWRDDNWSRVLPHLRQNELPRG